MGKALVIKGADFSAHKICTVNLDEESIKCTELTLDYTEISLSEIGSTTQITATKKPSNASDIVVWSSSNTTIATVSEGLVTMKGNGTATITAKCGDVVATCKVICDNMMLVVGRYHNGNSAVAGGNALAYLVKNSYRGVICASSGTLHLHVYYAEDPYYYPYIFPTGTKSITIDASELATDKIGVISFGWYNSETYVTNYPTTCKYIDGTNFSTYTPTATVEIPTIDDYPEIDSVVISFRSHANATMTDELMSKIKVTFNKE